jgi:hypothetical protein
MSLLRFRKSKDEPDENPQPQGTETEQRARDALAASLVIAKKMMSTPEFKELKTELANSAERVLDLLIQIDEQEADAERFSTRARNVLHKIKFLRAIEVLVEKKAGG